MFTRIMGYPTAPRDNATPLLSEALRTPRLTIHSQMFPPSDGITWATVVLNAGLLHRGSTMRDPLGLVLNV